jgi:hypothetical protein
MMHYHTVEAPLQTKSADYIQEISYYQEGMFHHPVNQAYYTMDATQSNCQTFII